jgi:pyridoxamine 5'-phosphate oxidase
VSGVAGVGSAPGVGVGSASGVGAGSAPGVGAGAARPTIPAGAWGLLTSWLPANDHPDRPQMTLSTVDVDGAPDARTVLLTEFGPEGFYFHTDSRSRKASDIAAHPAVALTILWPGFTRQIEIRGEAASAPAAEVAAAYRSRSPYLKQLAWLNTHEFAALPLADRVENWAAFEAAHPHGVDQPGSWAGYLVTPTRLTFWSSNPDTASQRIEFALDAGVWTRRVLAG